MAVGSVDATRVGARGGGIVIALAIALCGSAPVALADGPAGSNPSSNFPVGQLPAACYSDPSGATCVEAGVNYIDQARANLGQPPYVLPSDFAALSPAEQAFVLTNLDRILYGLPPVGGLTSGLDQDAAVGVSTDNDPEPSDSNWDAYTSNWDGGDQNMVLAYGEWMYNDGPGSGNLDCTSTDSSGCWGHRQDILWQFGSGGALAMGAAAGTDSSAAPSYAMLIEQDFPGVKPAYTYTWAQAVAAGAQPSGGSGSGSATVADASPRIERVRVHGHRITATISAPPGTALRCSLVGRDSHGTAVTRAKQCGRTVVFRHVPAGRYRLRVSSDVATATHRVLVS